ncbi:MAG: helix-turn-helix transcriptional regulator [Pseudomonadota bacterium]
MPDTPSLFAQKLKSWRTRHGAHGRVTQEGLAELLGVSVDAIGKYERSLSFIRGDLEHRLHENLGWDRDEIVACREDWELRSQPPDQTPYRVVDQTIVDEVFDGSWGKAVGAMNTMADAQFARIPDMCPINRDVFDVIYTQYINQWRAIECNGEIVAKWVVLTLFEEDEALFRAGELDEDTLSVDRVCQPLLPGTYFGYCPAVVVCPGHERASTLLIRAFADHLADLAARDVFFHNVGTVAVSRGGEAICKGLGMESLGICDVWGPHPMWGLSGAGIARSIFARRNPYLRARYQAEFCDADRPSHRPSLRLAHE